MAMATRTTTTKAGHDMDLLRQRLERVATRPTTVAANEFFTADGDDDWRTLPARLERLCHTLEHWTAERGSPDLAYALSDDPAEARRIQLTASVMVGSANRPTFYVDFESLFRASLAYRMQQQDMQDEEDTHNLAAVFSNEPLLFQNLRTLGWVRPSGLCERPLCQALRHCIYQIVKETIQGDFESPNLFQTIQTRCQIVKEWLEQFLTPTAVQQHHWRQHLDQLAARTFIQVRLEEIFELVADYPDSHTAVLELKHLLDYTYTPSSATAATNNNNSATTTLPHHEQHAELARSLRHALQSRLNHPGANTSQIIDVYINTIRVLRTMDPTDRLLRKVAEPVRTYLRSRPDTIRSIIGSLTDPVAGGDLYQELRRQDAKPLEHAAHTITLMGGGGSSGGGGGAGGHHHAGTAGAGGDGGQYYQDADDALDDEGPPGMDWQPAPSIFQPKGTFLESTSVATVASAAANGNADAVPAPNSDNNNAATPATDNSDILAMLVSIYGSKELFVNEYRLMLADKLLANMDYTTDKEVHTLELLKLRFGELSMRNCEIMLKDMNHSRRTNTLIKEELEEAAAKAAAAPPPPRRSARLGGGKNASNHQQQSTKKKTSPPVVDAVMVSHIFWPTLQKETLKHHPRIQAEIDEFGQAYGRIKTPRKLVWYNQLGTVQLELDVIVDNNDDDDGGSGETTVETRSFSCSPLLATLISHFEDQTVWTAEALSNETGVPEHVIQKRMAYWINNRVIRLVPASAAAAALSAEGIVLSSSLSSASQVVYELVSPHTAGRHGKDAHSPHPHHHHPMQSPSMMDDDDGAMMTSQGFSATAHEEETMKVYESYIVGMLTNLGQLPLNRIHDMLKMFVSGSDVRYDKTPQQLAVFLQHLCRQETLECGPDGMYRLFQK